MPTDTLENVLSQVQRVLDELANTGRTTLTHDELLTLAEHVDRIHKDEDHRINTLHKPRRVVHWDDDDYWDDEERAPE